MNSHSFLTNLAGYVYLICAVAVLSFRPILQLVDLYYRHCQHPVNYPDRVWLTIVSLH